MLSKAFFPILRKLNFKGVNAKDTIVNFVDGEWDKSSLNIVSDPIGSIGSRNGYTAITSASIGSAVAWGGFYQYVTHSAGSTTRKLIGGGSNGKIYYFDGTTYTEIGTGFATGVDARFSFFTLDNQCIVADGVNAAVVYTGSGSVATFATSVTADFGLEWQRYGWLHSTVDPRLMYYSPIGNPDGAYATFLNFDEDGEKVTGAAKQGDDMIVGKEYSLYRVQYRGTEPLFKKYRIPSTVGPVNFFSMSTLPDGRVVFPAPDFNFYMVDGDNVIPVGDNIQPYVKEGVKSRWNKSVAGLLKKSDQYWCSFTYASGATTNDKTVVMDWSRPYQDSLGRIQYPWFIFSIGANCFANITDAGDELLYFGGYVGKMYKADTGTNDAGTAIQSAYVSTIDDFGDPTIEKKLDKMSLALDAKGDWNLSISVVLDGNASTEKSITQNLQEGLGSISRWDEAIWDNNAWSSESDLTVNRVVDRQGKNVQVTMGTSGLDESWRVYYYVLHARSMRRAFRTRE